jgi:hypothetical protein
MKITTGTNCFPHFHAAIWHFRPYNQASSISEMNEFIRAKIKSGEIIIGNPELKAGQEKKLVDNRWHICE